MGQQYTPLPWDLAYKPVPFNPSPVDALKAIKPVPPATYQTMDQFNKNADAGQPPKVKQADGFFTGPAKVTDPPQNGQDISLPDPQYPEFSLNKPPARDFSSNIVQGDDFPEEEPSKPNVQNALAGLKSNGAIPYKPGFDSSSQDTNSQLYQLQKQRQGELEDRQASTPRDIDRIKALLSPLNQDIAENPTTKGIAQANDFNDENRSAINAGFKGGSVDQWGPNSYGSAASASPVQQAASSARGMEQQKIDSPVRVADITGQANVAAASQRALVYGGRTAQMAVKDLADNAAKIQAAEIAAGNRVGAAGVGKVITEISRLNEGLSLGRIADDDNTAAQMKFLKDQLSTFESPASGGQHPAAPASGMTADSHAQELVRANGGKSAGQIIADIDNDPSGGFERPEDREALRAALGRLGVR